MEDVRYAASFAAGPSNKEKMKELADKQQVYIILYCIVREKGL